MSRVMEVLDQRVEFDSDGKQRCPACGADEFFHRIEFTTEKKVRDSSGKLSMRTTTMGERDPHLEVTCGRCGAQWEMETMT